jgi:hypothetical protein
MLLVLILLVGTMGYVGLEGWPVLDALYMTIITITTVGFGEVNVVSSSGRVFTICIIFMGMGIMAYSLGMVAQIMVETQVRTILGRRKLGKGGEMILNPSSETLIKAGNTLIALGPAKDLDRLSKILLH